MAAKTCKDRFLTEDGVILAVNSSYGKMTRLARDVAEQWVHFRVVAS